MYIYILSAFSFLHTLPPPHTHTLTHSQHTHKHMSVQIYMMTLNFRKKSAEQLTPKYLAAAHLLKKGNPPRTHTHSITFMAPKYEITLCVCVLSLTAGGLVTYARAVGYICVGGWLHVRGWVGCMTAQRAGTWWVG